MKFRPLLSFVSSLAAAALLGACAEEPAAPSAEVAPVAAVEVTPALPELPAFDPADLDPSSAACADLNTYVNSRWLAANPVPGDRTTWGSFEMLGERSLAVQKLLAEGAAAKPDAHGVEKLVGDLWATGMDQARIEALGAAPLEPLLAEIAALSSPAAIADHVMASHAKGRGVLFGFGGSADFKDSAQQIAFVGQGGLGLPDRDYYLMDRGDYVAKREAYRTHVGRMLELSGVEPAAAASQAEAVLAFETRLARVSKSTAELSRDVSLAYNPVSPAAADTMTPHFSWTRFLTAQGLAVPPTFSLAQPEFFAEVDAMLAAVSIDDWKAYLRYHTIDDLAPFLSEAFVQQHFDFHARALRGQKENKPRWKRTLDVVNNQAGEALGEIYVRENFPPASKARMQELVANLSAALETRIGGLEWMTEGTKQKALEKWSSFTPKIGYPDKWRSWEGLATTRDSYVDNVLTAVAFNHRYEMGKIGKPVDRSLWGMSPQTVNAYYNPQLNEIVFPAAILQPPFFDPAADDALNYGGIGAVIGHEMLHGYDDQGSRFDASGNFVNWWQKADADDFAKRTAQLVEQFDGYVALVDEKDGELHVDGELTLGENIADLGGLTVAYAALKRAQGEGFTDPKVDGFTQDQRFFLNWATVWRRGMTTDELKVRLDTDPHAPGRFRAIGAPSNLPIFAEAFGCKEGDPMVRPAASRVSIW